MALEPGDLAPDFTTTDQNGKKVNLSRFRGKKVALYFYPTDDTPTCTEQACNLRDNYAAIKKKGYVLLGISTDNAKSHTRFIARYNLPFPLLTDEDHAIVNAYGLWVEKTMFGKTFMGTARTTFLINEEGVIENIIRKVRAKNHADQILGNTA